MSDDALLVGLAYGFLDFVSSALSGPVGKVAIPSVVAVAGLVLLNYLHSRRSGYLFRMEQEALARIDAAAAARKGEAEAWIKLYIQSAFAPQLSELRELSTKNTMNILSMLGKMIDSMNKASAAETTPAIQKFLAGLPDCSALYGDECALDKAGNLTSPEGPAAFEWKYNRECTETDLVAKPKEPTTGQVSPGSSVSGYIDTNRCSSSVQLGQRADSGFYTTPGSTSYLHLQGGEGIGFAFTPTSVTQASEATTATTEKEPA